MLDKIDNTGLAQAFRNGVKAPFGIGGYVCLISVSEHATCNLRLRGLLFRDAFDDILRGGPLSLDRAIRLIERRVFRLQRPFPMPCHCLSGGLPCDLIRVCRCLLKETTAPEAGAETLPAAALRLVAADIRGRLAGAKAAALQNGGRGDNRLVAMLGQIETDCDLAGADAARLIALLPEAAAALADSAAELARAEVPAASALARRAVAELTVYFALAATGLALFGLAPGAAGQRAAPAPGGAAAQLARARGRPSPMVRRPPCPGSMPYAPTSPAPRQCTARGTLPRRVDGDAHRSPGRIRAAGAMRSPRPAGRAAHRSRTFLRAGFFPRPRPGERRRAVFPVASPGADPPVPGMQGLGPSSGTLRRL